MIPQLETKFTLTQIVQLSEFQRGLGVQAEHVEVDTSPIIQALKFLVAVSPNKAQELSYLQYQFENEDASIEERKMAGSFLVTYESDKVWWIRSAFVKKQCRSQGVFTKMEKRACLKAQQKGVQQMRLYRNRDNHRAYKLYTKLGYKLCSTIFLCHTLDQAQLQTTNSTNLKISLTHHNLPENSLIELFHPIPKDEQIRKHHRKAFILLQEQVIGDCRFYYQFSDWGFGILLIISSLRLENRIVEKLKQGQIQIEEIVGNLVRVCKSELDERMIVMEIRLLGRREEELDTSKELIGLFKRWQFYEEDYDVLQKSL